MVARSRTFVDVMNRTCDQFKLNQCSDYLKMTDKQYIIETVKQKYNVETKLCKNQVNIIIEKDWDVVFNANSHSHLQRFDSERVVKWDPIKKNAENRIVTIDLFNSQMKSQILQNNDNATLLLEKFLASIVKYFIFDSICPSPIDTLTDIKNDYRDVSKLNGHIAKLKEYSNDCYIKEGAYVREDSVIKILQSFITQIEHFIEQRIIQVCEIGNTALDPQNIVSVAGITANQNNNIIDEDL